MSRPISVNGGIARAACIKWSDMPSLSLARKIYKDNPGCWLTLESARSSVRYIRGNSGKRLREVMKCNSGIVDTTASSVPHNPYKLPPSDEILYEPYILEYNEDIKITSLSDCHFPYHSVKALTEVIGHMEKRKPDVIILNGDIIDFHRLSKFMKDPRARNIVKEIEAVNQFLDILDTTFPKTKKIWKDGNHEERLDHYIRIKAPELYDLEITTVLQVMMLEARGWDYVGDKGLIYAGDLTILHGHEYPTPMIGPVNAARGLFLRSKGSALVGHHHQTSEHSESTIRGDIITTYSQACLCELHPDYAKLNKWNQGYADIDLEPGGKFQITNIRI